MAALVADQLKKTGQDLCSNKSDQANKTSGKK